MKESILKKTIKEKTGREFIYGHGEYHAEYFYNMSTEDLFQEFLDHDNLNNFLGSYKVKSIQEWYLKYFKSTYVKDFMGTDEDDSELDVWEVFLVKFYRSEDSIIERINEERGKNDKEPITV